MVITNFEQNEADERVSLPKDQLAKPREEARDDSFVLNLGFDFDANDEKDYSQEYLFFGDERFTVDNCRKRLQQEAQFYQVAGTKLADVTVEIRADAGVKSGSVQKLMQICQEQDIAFERFALRATQKVD